jgi:hypothetical protein
LGGPLQTKDASKTVQKLLLSQEIKETDTQLL